MDRGDLKRKSARYVTLKSLSQGGMAQLYLARRDPPSDRGDLFVLKTLLPQLAEDKMFRTMFLDEIRLCQRLRHPNLVRTHGIGKSKGRPYLVMEFLDGLSLKQIREAVEKSERPLPPEQVAYIAAEVCSGLDYAHRLTNEQGEPLQIIHRDVSPENIIVLYNGSVKLVDFGISRAEDRLSRTIAGTIKGKFAYMAPEQVLNEAVDARSDIFSLGIVCWELLSGRRLFKCNLDIDTMRSVAFSQVPEMGLFRAGIPFELESIVQKALQKEPANRFQTAAEMGGALREFLDQKFPAVGARKLALTIEILESESEPTLRNKRDDLNATHQSKSDLSAACEATVQQAIDPEILSDMRQTIPVKPRKTDPPTMAGYRLSSTGNVQVDSSVLAGVSLSLPPPLPATTDSEPDLETAVPQEAVHSSLWARLKTFVRSRLR